MPILPRGQVSQLFADHHASVALGPDG
jgi:hypothetical protein